MILTFASSVHARTHALQLYYFNIKGKGEPVRLACKYAGIKLEDVRMGRDEFAAMKAEGKLPFGQLPYATFHDGEDELFGTAQMRAIMRAVGMVSLTSSAYRPLYSASIEEATRIDAMMDFEEDLMIAMRASIFPERFGHDEYKNDSEKIRRRERICSTVLKGKLEVLDGILAKVDGGFVAGTAEPSLADFVMVPALQSLTSGLLDGVPTTILDSYSSIKEYLTRFEEQTA